MDPMPPLTTVFSLIQQQETKIQIRTSTINESSINLVEHRKGIGRGRGGTPHSSRGHGSGKICTYCGKSSHTVDVCSVSKPREFTPTANNVVGEGIKEQDDEDAPQN